MNLAESMLLNLLSARYICTYISIFILHGVAFGQQCFTTEAFALPGYVMPPVTQSSVLAEDHCISVYVEVDFATFYEFSQDIDSVETWIRANIEEVQETFLQEQVNIYLAGFLIPSAPTWADALSSLSDILYAFGGHVDDDVAMMKVFLTTRMMGGGIAWINGFCYPSIPLSSGGYYGPYSVTGSLSKEVIPRPTYSWNVAAISHELGHNFGLYHAHACKYGPGDSLAVDDAWFQEYGPCSLIQPVEYSTIMSYGHLTIYGIDFAIGFGNTIGDQLRANIAFRGCATYTLGGSSFSGSLSGDVWQEFMTINDGDADNLNVRTRDIEIHPISEFTNFTVDILGCP